MEAKRKCALVAARPAGCRVLQQMLGDTLDVMPVQTMADAYALLASRQSIDLIVATFAFDDSHMIEFLQAIKHDRALREIPFYCVRVHPGILGDELAGLMGAACVECGAAAFLDVTHLSRESAIHALTEAIGAVTRSA